MWVCSLAWEDPLEVDMAIHSSILAWSIPWAEKHGGLWSIGSCRGRHDCSDLACIYIYIRLSLLSLECKLQEGRKFCLCDSHCACHFI